MIYPPVSVEKTKIAWIVGVATGFWGGFHPLIQTLVVLILLDFASGLTDAVHEDWICDVARAITRPR
jgi:phage-related holin